MDKVCLKGGLRTPVGGGVSSLNVQLRRELDLYASLVHCFNLQGLPTRHEKVDIVVIRENTEGEYSGLEHEVVPGVVESLKIKMCLTGHKYRESGLRQVITKVLFDRIANSILTDPLIDLSPVSTLVDDKRFEKQAERPLIFDMTASVETQAKVSARLDPFVDVQNSELAPCTLHLSVRILLHRR
ncbi:hypothetical protein C4D60_Mb09t06700 [Musa balbisiana]|uniref:Isopropylmalate dehydrogenase-like domain-containing protein n=1 Tax=Musa balbisiana TaxID=52838 RepID=A0A4S8IEI4_MUSBA|nr:hypothetical protein C4D60_Mb09t06700 [Musa balbisiana]